MSQPAVESLLAGFQSKYCPGGTREMGVRGTGLRGVIGIDTPAPPLNASDPCVVPVLVRFRGFNMSLEPWTYGQL